MNGAGIDPQGGEPGIYGVPEENTSRRHIVCDNVGIVPRSRKSSDFRRDKGRGLQPIKLRRSDHPASEALAHVDNVARPAFETTPSGERLYYNSLKFVFVIPVTTFTTFAIYPITPRAHHGILKSRRYLSARTEEDEDSRRLMIGLAFFSF